MRASLYGALALVSSSVPAADVPRLEALFAETFVSHYQPRFCGENVTRFLSQAAARGIDLKGASVFKIVGGAWNLQTFAARGLRAGRAQPFEFHWIVVAEGRVFDYDFTDRARVPKLDEYVMEMFIPRTKYVMGNFDPIHELRERIVFTAFEAEAFVRNLYSANGLASQDFRAAELVAVDEIIERAACRALLRP